jgi:hypothetical protein
MTFEYCETCKKITGGGYFPSADKDISIFHCRICGAITCITAKNYYFKFYEYDVKLRNEANRLQLQYYKALNKKQNIRRLT